MEIDFRVVIVWVNGQHPEKTLFTYQEVNDFTIRDVNITLKSGEVSDVHQKDKRSDSIYDKQIEFPSIMRSVNWVKGIES